MEKAEVKIKELTEKSRELEVKFEQLEGEIKLGKEQEAVREKRVNSKRGGVSGRRKYVYRNGY